MAFLMLVGQKLALVELELVLQFQLALRYLASKLIP